MSRRLLAQHPHVAWLQFRTSYGPGAKFGFHSLNVAHTLMFMVRGQTKGYWQGKPATGFTGEVRFIPADGEQTAISGATDHGCEWVTLLIPPTEAIQVATEEGVVFPGTLALQTLLDDECVRKCLGYLAACAPADTASGKVDEACRRLLLRLCELSGGGVPDWHDDASVFDRRTLLHIFQHIDTNLTLAPSLSELGKLVDLSPSHFARKFRQSVGMSPHRFINNRRIASALELLKDPSLPLAHVAIALGFSSQSHFTCLFHETTGMTPAKYRKRFRPVVG
mgnify:CR=1 FL=1